MNETVWIVLIIAATVVIALFLFRRNLSDFLFKANKEGLEARLKTHKSPDESSSKVELGTSEGKASVSITRSRLFGKRNEIEVGRDDVKVDDNWLVGEDQKLRVKSERKTPKQK